MNVADIGQVDALTSLYLEAVLGHPRAVSKYIYNSSGDLAEKVTYSDSSYKTKLFIKTYFYGSSGDMAKIVNTRVSDGATITKIFEYTRGVDLDKKEVY
jgi:hypothetical protein